MFWTDWGAQPAIIRAGMDGSFPLDIIRDNLKWPNGITVDHGNGRIYWTDASTDRIESAKFDGGDRRIVRSAGIKHPFGVDVMGDMVFWSDWNMYEIQVSFLIFLNKFPLQALYCFIFSFRRPAISLTGPTGSPL